jgi:hypothetical protein
VQKRIPDVTALLADDSPPELVLNRHCSQCEFEARCRKQATEKDDLGLLSGMSGKDHVFGPRRLTVFRIKAAIVLYLNIGLFFLTERLKHWQERTIGNRRAA